MGKQWTCPFAFFCIYFAFSICFFLHLFCFLPGKKQKKQNNTKKKQIEKANRKSKISAKKCKWTSPFFPFFPPLKFLFFTHLFMLPVFFSLKFCCLIFHVFSCFVLIFSSFNIIRISYWGEHKTRIQLHPITSYYNLLHPLSTALSPCWNFWTLPLGNHPLLLRPWNPSWC